MPSIQLFVYIICSKAIKTFGAIGSQKGSILVFVVLACAALLVLGVSLADISGLDLKIAVNQRDSIQAHYLAESGIDVAKGILAKHDPLYTGSGEVSMHGGRITLSISAVNQHGGSRLVEIISTGRFGVVQEQISVSFRSFPVDPAGTGGSSLGWYDAASRLIVPGRHDGGSANVFMGSAAAAPLRLAAATNSDGAAYLAASQIFFRGVPSSLLLEENLEIASTVVVFRGNIVLGPPRGSITFSHAANDAVRVYLQNSIITADQRLLLSPGVYNFPRNMQINAAAAPQDLLAYRIFPLVPGTMIYRGRR